MSEIVIIQNISHEGPGLLAEVLRGEGISYDVVDLARDNPLPSPTSYKAIVALGGPDSANDTTPKMTSELHYIKSVLDKNIPYLGICLGMQTLVKAAGGSVIRAENKEIGFIDPKGQPYNVRITDEGKNSPLLANLPDNLAVFHLHGETVELTETMQLLGSGTYCRNQIVQVTNNAYGIQSHFELTPEMLSTWAEQDPDLTPLGKDKLLTDFETIREEYTKIGKALFRNFLNIARL